MATYLETLSNVRSWSDRDSTVLTDALIKTFLGYAADKAYRTLRVPSLETSLDFTVTSGDIIADSSNTGTEISMTIPSDLIEVIYIQKKGEGMVWNQKVDPRTFHDRYADKKSYQFYTRTGSTILLHGYINEGDVLEVHYYKRLSSIAATYTVNTSNYLTQTTSLSTMNRVTGLEVPVTYASSALVLDGDSKPTMVLRKGKTYVFDVSDGTMGSKTLVFKDSAGSTYNTGITPSGTPGQANANYTFIVPSDAPDTLTYQEGSTASAGNSVSLASESYLDTLDFVALYFADAVTGAQVDSLTPTVVKSASETSYTQRIWFQPDYIANWLRDENEKILLYGALNEAYDFLEEPENAARYKVRFDEEIAQLNTEEHKRQARGGNTSISFSGMGLI